MESSTSLHNDTTAEHEPITSSLDARRDWDNRYGTLTTSVRHGQLACGITAACSLVLSIGCVLLSLQREVGWEATREIALVVPTTRAERHRSPLGLWMATLPWAPLSRR